MAAGDKSTELLTRLISAKRQVLKIVVQMSERQMDMIATGQTENLMKLLSAKQTVLDQLQTLERELAVFRDDDPEKRVWTSSAARAACQKEAAEANVLIARSLELERQAEVAMIAKRQATGQLLSSLQAATDAQSAYVTGAGMPFSGLQMEG